MNTNVLEAKKISKYFYDPVKVQVLSNIDLAVKRGRIHFHHREVGVWKIYSSVYTFNDGY